MDDENLPNVKVYFFYCPSKVVEKKYKLSFFLFSEENGESEFIDKYEKFALKLNDGNYNIYLISFEIDNNKNYDYFNVIIDENDNKKYNSEYYNLENGKDTFLLDLEFSNEFPNIKTNLKFKDMYEYYKSFLDSQFKNEILSKKYEDFWDCILNSSYKEISDYFFDILQKMNSLNNFSKLGNLFLKYKKSKINDENIIKKLDSEEIYKNLKKNIDKNQKLKSKKYSIFNNYFSLLFSYYNKNKMLNEFINLVIKSSSENFMIKYAIFNSLIQYSKTFKKLDLKNWVENLEKFGPNYNIDSKILSSFLNMVNTLEDQLTIIFEESKEPAKLKKKKYISKYISKELKNLIEKEKENPKYAINIDNQLNLTNYKNNEITEDLIENIYNYLLTNYLNQEMKGKNEFHILYTFNSINVLRSLSFKSNNIRTLTNIKTSLSEIFNEKNNKNENIKDKEKINDDINIKIEAVIKSQLIAPIFNNVENEIAEYIKQLIRFCKFSKEEIKNIIEKEQIKNEVMSKFGEININVLNNIIQDKKDKDLTDFKILENQTFNEILNYVFSPFHTNQNSENLKNIGILYKLFPKLRIKTFPFEIIFILISYFIDLIIDISNKLKLNDKNEFIEFIKNFDKICDLIISNNLLKEVTNDLEKKLYNCFKNKNCDYLIFFIEEFLILKTSKEKEKKITNVDLIEKLLIEAFKENVDKEDSKTLIEKLIKNKNNINYDLIVIVINNKNINFNIEDFYQKEMSYDEEFLLFLSEKNLLTDKIINQCEKLENLLKFYALKKDKILQKNMKIKEMMKFYNFNNQILDKKFKLNDIKSNKNQE